jgi:LEA14-like dessication related protein
MPLTRTRSAALLSSLLLSLATAAALCLSSCAGFGHVFQKPRVRVLGAEVANVSLASADLVFDVSVEIPNAVSFVLHGVGYHLRVNGEPFLDGSNALEAQIAAHGVSRVQLPVTLHFADVLRVLRLLEGDRRAGYALEAEFRFSVPVLGNLSVPVRKQGNFSLADLHLSP